MTIQNPAYRSSAFFFCIFYERMLKKLVRYLKVGIWQVQDSSLSPVKRLCLDVLKKLILTIRFFTARKVMNVASALTYSTLLAIVPIMAVVFAIARGFGYNKYIEVWFRETFESQPQAAEAIIGFVNSYLTHTKSGVILGIGLVFMLYTVLMLISNIEGAFNSIWQVKKPRSIFRTFTDYLAMLLLFPVIIVLTSGISIFMTTIADEIPRIELLAPVVRFIIDLLPYIIMSIMFVGLYVFMPNTHVKVRNAIVPGILAGVAMQWLQYFYINSQLWMSGYNAIYGSFAALPMFMLWVQISWTICLFGAELSYTNQNLDYYDYDTHTGDLSHRYKLMLSAMLMSHICRQFDNGGRPYTNMQLRDKTDIPIRIVNELLYELIEARLIIEINSDEKGESSQYVPSENVDKLTLGVMIGRLEAKGNWKICLPLERHYHDGWSKAIKIRRDYINSSNNILLKDL